MLCNQSERRKEKSHTHLQVINNVQVQTLEDITFFFITRGICYKYDVIILQLMITIIYRLNLYTCTKSLCLDDILKGMNIRGMSIRTS